MTNSTLKEYSSMDSTIELFEEYVEAASFLWVLRSIAVSEPNYNSSDIAELELRIDAQLDGLMVVIDSAWQVCEKALEMQQVGEIFTATVIAFRSRDINKIKIAISAGLLTSETFKGVVSAIGWLPDKIALPWITKFLNSKDLDHKYLAIAACSVRREDPHELLAKILNREDCIAHDNLYSRSLRLVGELRRQDLMPALTKAMLSENTDAVYWANWSAILLGNKSAAIKLFRFIDNEGPYQDITIQMIFRVIPINQARIWITEMVKSGNQIRAVIKAIGVLGDPHAINWLITIMNQPNFARLAGEAFTNITGIDLEEKKLSIEEPEDYQSLPNDDVSDNTVLMDDDEYLPWPDHKKVSRIWKKYGRKFIIGQRYFLGKAITTELLKTTIMTATQRQRRSAALELALIDSEIQLINICCRKLA